MSNCPSENVWNVFSPSFELALDQDWLHVKIRDFPKLQSC